MPTSQLTVSGTTAVPASQLTVSRGQRPLSTLQLCPEENGLAYITAVSRGQRPCLQHSCVQRTTALPTSQLTVSRGQQPCLYHSCLYPEDNSLAYITAVSRGQRPLSTLHLCPEDNGLAYITAYIVSNGQPPCLHDG